MLHGAERTEILNILNYFIVNFYMLSKFVFDEVKCFFFFLELCWENACVGVIKDE